MKQSKKEYGSSACLVNDDASFFLADACFLAAASASGTAACSGFASCSIPCGVAGSGRCVCCELTWRDASSETISLHSDCGELTLHTSAMKKHKQKGSNSHEKAFEAPVYQLCELLLTLLRFSNGISQMFEICRIEICRSRHQNNAILFFELSLILFFVCF